MQKPTEKPLKYFAVVGGGTCSVQLLTTSCTCTIAILVHVTDIMHHANFFHDSCGTSSISWKVLNSEHHFYDVSPAVLVPKFL